MNNLEDDHVIDRDVVEAAIIDFINYVAGMWGVDYGIYTRDLNDPRRFDEPSTANKTLEEFEDAVIGLYLAEEHEYADPNRENSDYARKKYQKLRSELLKQMEVENVVP
jgi:hypothetical protein